MSNENKLFCSEKPLYRVSFKERSPLRANEAFMTIRTSVVDPGLNTWWCGK